MRLAVLLTSAALAIAGTHSSTAVADDGRMEPALLAELLELREQVLDDYNRGDVRALVSHYAEDAWHVSPRRPPVRGREALAEFYAPAMKFYRMRAETTVLDAEREGDSATLLLETVLHGEPRPEAGDAGREVAPFTERRLNLTQFRRQPDGRWLIRRYIDTTPPAPREP